MKQMSRLPRVQSQVPELPQSIYRTNSYQAPIVKIPFEQKFPRLVRTGSVGLRWITGVGMMLGLTLIGWVVFPGAYYLGRYVVNTRLGWEWREINAGPQCWLAGVLLEFAPFFFSYCSYRMGCWVWDNKK